jgi:hypothetical protein
MKHNRQLPYPFALILMLWALCGVANAQQASAKYRGKQLRNEVRKTTVKSTFTCRLAKDTAPYIVLEFREQRELTHSEVTVYQAMQEIVKEQVDGIDIVKEFAPIPGETIDGEETERIEIQVGAPLANEALVIQGRNYITDATGSLVDREQQLLALFDPLNTRSFELAIAHATLGEQRITLTRDLISRQTPPSPSSSSAPQFDILEAFGLNFVQQMQAGREGLKVQLSVKGVIAAGGRIDLLIEVENTGAKPVSNLLARSFSRHPWLNGKLFYFGLLPSNSQASFTRHVHIPADADCSQLAYLSVAFWDILGAIDDKRQDLCLNAPNE